MPCVACLSHGPSALFCTPTVSELVVKAFREVIVEATSSATSPEARTAPRGVIPIEPAVWKGLPMGGSGDGMWNSVLYPVDAVGKMEFEASTTSGCAKPKVMYAHCPMENPLPFEALLPQDALDGTKVAGDADKRRVALEGCTAALDKMYTEVRRAVGETGLSAAEALWAAARVKVAPTVTELAGVFEEVVFPNNRYTRRRADQRGAQLYLPGLIKAVLSDFNYKKIFSTKSAGGKREYTACIVLDTSMSMGGHLQDCAVETLVLLILALQQAGIESWSLIACGQRVVLLKSEQQPFDSTAIFALLSNIRFDAGVGTLDAVAVAYGLDLLAASPIRGTKRMFVLTDGYSTCGLQVTRSFAFCVCVPVNAR